MLKPKGTSSKDQFIVTHGKEKQQIITFEMLKPENIQPFCLKNVRNYYSIIRIVADSFSVA